MSRLTNDEIRNRAISIIRNLTAEENGLTHGDLGILSSFLLIERTDKYKLTHYKDLEEQLEELFGGKLPLDKVVETLKRIVQNGEEKLDFARILTNAEAEKWDKWRTLEEQGRLIEQKHGKWIPFELDTRGYVEIMYYECSSCHEISDDATMYCPHCGANMDEVE